MARAPMRRVLQVLTVKRKAGAPGGGINYVLDLSCGHRVGRNLLRLGYNRERRDRAGCSVCQRGGAA